MIPHEISATRANRAVAVAPLPLRVTRSVKGIPRRVCSIAASTSVKRAKDAPMRRSAHIEHRTNSAQCAHRLSPSIFAPKVFCHAIQARDN